MYSETVNVVITHRPAMRANQTAVPVQLLHTLGRRTLIKEPAKSGPDGFMRPRRRPPEAPTTSGAVALSGSLADPKKANVMTIEGGLSPQGKRTQPLDCGKLKTDRNCR